MGYVFSPRKSVVKSIGTSVEHLNFFTQGLSPSSVEADGYGCPKALALLDLAEEVEALRLAEKAIP